MKRKAIKHALCLLTAVTLVTLMCAPAFAVYIGTHPVGVTFNISVSAPTTNIQNVVTTVFVLGKGITYLTETTAPGTTNTLSFTPRNGDVRVIVECDPPLGGSAFIAFNGAYETTITTGTSFVYDLVK